jgi:hypothetical protein
LEGKPGDLSQPCQFRFEECTSRLQHYHISKGLLRMAVPLNMPGVFSPIEAPVAE